MRNIIILIAVSVCVFVLFDVSAYASALDGTISSAESMTRICKNESCSSYGNINWKPTLNANTTGATAVNISNGLITGWLWGDEIGWVNMQPTGQGVSVSAAGVVSGYAYANTGSWINFSPTIESGGTTVGVTINSNGQFTGWAYVSGISGGWMKFDCSTPSTCVSTDWRPTAGTDSTPTIFTSSSIAPLGVGSILVAATATDTDPFSSAVTVVDGVPSGWSGTQSTGIVTGSETHEISAVSNASNTRLVSQEKARGLVTVSPWGLLGEQCDFWGSLSCKFPIKVILVLSTGILLYVVSKLLLFI